jgi:uncharacterized delta-60 repeat protein
MGAVAQADGKIAVAYAANNQFLVARYNVNGSLDAGFGTGGEAVTKFNGNDTASAVGVQPQPDGTDKIVAAGSTYTQITKGRNTYRTQYLALDRYNADGTLDTTFGGTGKVTTVVSWPLVPTDVVVDSLGRIMVATVFSNQTELFRYTANGALDSTFGSGGEVVTAVRMTGNGDYLVVQPDGKIVLGGYEVTPAGHGQFAVARFNANGTPDTGFGASGVATTYVGYNDGSGGVALQPDGKLVVGGQEAPSSSSLPICCLVRFNPDGSLDTGFGAGGVAIVALPSGFISFGAQGVAIQADGEIVVGGHITDSAHIGYFAAVRVSPAGASDPGYSTGGWAVAPVFNSTDGPRVAVMEPDGRLVDVGIGGPTSGPSGFELVRFLASAPQVGSFTASPNPVTSGSSLTLTASNISDGNPNSTVTQVAFYYIDSTGTQQVLGYGTSDGLGNWVLSFTVNLPPGTYTLYAQAEDSYGAFGDPFALTLTVQ